MDRRPQVYQLLLSQPFFSNYKAGTVWLSLRGMLGRARGTRRGEENSSSFLSSYVLDISSFVPQLPQPPPPPPKKKKMASATQAMIGYGEGTYSLEFMRVSKQGMNLPETDQGLGFVRVTLVLL